MTGCDLYYLSYRMENKRPEGFLPTFRTLSLPIQSQHHLRPQAQAAAARQVAGKVGWNRAAFQESAIGASQVCHGEFLRRRVEMNFGVTARDIRFAKQLRQVAPQQEGEIEQFQALAEIGRLAGLFDH